MVLSQFTFYFVAWDRIYAPFSHDFDVVCPIKHLLFGNCDPSIFNALTVPSAVPEVKVDNFVGLSTR